MRTVICLALLIATAAGCSAASSGASVNPDPASDGPSPTSPAIPGVAAAVLDPILTDAATRAGVNRSDLAVAEARAVTWNDGSLGCPQPGMAYTQALVDGWQVIVEAGDERLDYRVSGPGQFMVCDQG